MPDRRLPGTLYAERLERLQELIVAAEAEAFLCLPGTNFLYLTGLGAHRSERLIALLVPAEGHPEIVAPAFERERLAQNRLFAEIRTWEENEDPFRLVTQRLSHPRTRAREILLEASTDVVTAARLARADDKLDLVADEEAMDTLRARKCAHELALLRHAIRLTHDARDEVAKGLKAGVTEAEVAAALTTTLSSKSGEPAWALAQFGPSASVPHGEPGPRRLAKGDVVLLDCGTSFGGYQGDITRTFVFGGEPAGEVRKVMQIVKKAHDAAIELAGPGVQCEDVDAAARKVIEKSGFGDYFTHRTGHGLGMDVHEQPYLVRGNKRRLTAGNVVTVEPGIYLPGKFGVRHENDVLITDSGAEVLVEK
ncbi:MAG: aminopeptidase P family protein [Planctomycetes bacterium]|nr:aminopeptidase P family protein [Planctomycetota bacterium]